MRHEGMVYKYLISALIGVLLGYKILPPLISAILFGALMVVFLFYVMTSNVEKALLVLPFIVFGEIFFRGHARAYLPYLSVQYLFIIGFGILLVKSNFSKSNFHFKPIFLLIVFFLLEIFNGFFSSTPQVTYAIQAHTLALLVPAIWASTHKLSPVLVNKIMDNVRVATVLLAGIVLVAHLQDKIDYDSASNSDASNNMAPVQLSGYLGTGAILFIISILNPSDKRSKFVQTFSLVVIVTLMALTFSRGGVYFLGIITMIYMIFNKSNLGNYFKFLILIPIGLIIYNFVVEKTEGKIIDRYQAQGASNREKLVAIGFIIYADNPILGIGTGNYHSYIKKEKLFQMESGAHNEFVRAAAEHGTVGVVLYWGFFIVLLWTIFKRQKPARDYGVYFVVLFILITIHNGLKISVQPFILIMAISIVPIATSSKRIMHVPAKLQRA